MDSLELENLVKPLLLKDLRIQCRQRGLSPAGSRDELALRLKEHMLQTNDFHLRLEDGSIMSGPTASQLFGQASTNTGNNFQRPSGQNVGNFLGDRPSSRVLAAPGGNSSFSLGHGAAPAHHQPQFAPATPQTRAPPAPIMTQPAQTTPQTGKTSAFLDSMAASIAGKSGHKFAPTPPAAAAPPSSHVSNGYSANYAPENLQMQPGQQPGANGNVAGGNNNYHRPGGQNVGNFLTDKPSSRVLAPPGGASSITFG